VHLLNHAMDNRKDRVSQQDRGQLWKEKSRDFFFKLNIAAVVAVLAVFFYKRVSVTDAIFQFSKIILK
jgi:hypothetical protein